MLRSLERSSSCLWKMSSVQHLVEPSQMCFLHPIRPFTRLRHFQESHTGRPIESSCYRRTTPTSHFALVTKPPRQDQLLATLCPRLRHSSGRLFAPLTPRPPFQMGWLHPTVIWCSQKSSLHCTTNIATNLRLGLYPIYFVLTLCRCWCAHPRRWWSKGECHLLH